MKKLEIKTEKATLLVVDDRNWDGCIHEFVGVNYNGFKHLGKVSEITEEEWANIIEDGDMTPGCCTYTVGYGDYTIDELTPMFEFDNATESGLSLLKANGVVLDNPLGKHPNATDEDAGTDKELDKIIWNKEQEKVWPNPHVFIKID